MDTLQFLLGGFAVALTPENLMVAAVGALIGTLVIMYSLNSGSIQL